jgi:hypothetical protein
MESACARHRLVWASYLTFSSIQYNIFLSASLKIRVQVFFIDDRIVLCSRDNLLDFISATFFEELSFSIDFIWSFKSVNETVRMSLFSSTILFSFEFLDWLLWSIGLPGKLYYLTKCCYFLLDTRKILERKTSMVFVRNTLFQPLILLLSALAEYL